MKRHVFCWLFVLLLFVCALPVYALDEEREEQEGKAAQERIVEMYEAAKAYAKRDSFRGYCGAYINSLMMVYGINTQYVKGNGNQVFDNYKNLDESTGGYTITAYDCREYTLEEALLDISTQSEIAHNIVIGFTRSPKSEAGKKYGHCVYIDTIMNGMVYYSECYTVKFGEESIESGTPLVRTLEEFLDYYKNYKLDGVLYFTLPVEQNTEDDLLDIVDILELEWADDLLQEGREEALEEE